MWVNQGLENINGMVALPNFFHPVSEGYKVEQDRNSVNSLSGLGSLGFDFGSFSGGAGTILAIGGVALLGWMLWGSDLAKVRKSKLLAEDKRHRDAIKDIKTKYSRKKFRLQAYRELEA